MEYPEKMEELIEIDSRIMVGKPVIKGTRITVEMIVGKLASGESVEEILASYPHLNRRQILACLEYVHQSMRSDFVYPVVREAA